MKRFFLWVSTCGPIGKSAIAPGTLASFVTLPFVFVLSGTPFWYVLATVAVTGLAVWSSAIGAQVLHVKDPGSVVIDEVVGMLITFVWIAATPKRLLIGFLLFRFFDILKPPPIRWSEHFPDGIGIVLDDVIAAVYANLILRFAILYAKL